MAVRTALLGFGRIQGSGWHDCYLGPVGTTTILKNVRASIVGAGSVPIELWIGASGRSAQIMRPTITSSTPVDDDTWLVVPAGANLTWNVGAVTDFSYQLSGAILYGVTDYPPQAPSARTDLVGVLPA